MVLLEENSTMKNYTTTTALNNLVHCNYGTFSRGSHDAVQLYWASVERDIYRLIDKITKAERNQAPRDQLYDDKVILVQKIRAMKQAPGTYSGYSRIEFYFKQIGCSLKEWLQAMSELDKPNKENTQRCQPLNNPTSAL